MLQCDEVRFEFPALERGGLSPELRAQIEEHLGNCILCREARAQDAAIAQLLNEAGAPRASQGFDRRVRAALERELAAAPPSRRWSPRVRAAVLLAASLLLAAGAWKALTINHDDDSEVIAHLDLLEPLSLLHDELPGEESALYLQLPTGASGSPLETLMRSEDGDL